jgi:multiple antibiotic resistance protein
VDNLKQTMSLVAYCFLALSSLFVIVDPIATIPAFIAMTPRDSVASRLSMARLACLVAAGVLILFALSGQWIFRLLGITLPAFQIAGSVLLLRIALDMLYAKRSAAQETREETEAGATKDDVAITPLGVPMLAGPGAISTSLILMNQAQDWEQRTALLLSIVVVSFASYLVLRLSVYGARWLNPSAIKLITRLMGLLLAAIAVQFALNGLEQTALFRK